MKITICFLFILLVSCGKNLEPNMKLRYSSIEGKYLPYVNKFISMAGSKGISLETDGLVMITADLPVGTLGTCDYGRGLSEVRIDRRMWSFLDSANKEQLVFHELGHCLLGRQHNDSLINGNMNGSYVIIPRSVMSSQIFGSSSYVYFYSYYIEELFGIVANSYSASRESFSAIASTIGPDSIDQNNLNSHCQITEEPEGLSE